MGDDWLVGEPTPYFSNPASVDELAACPGLRAYNDVDSLFITQREFRSDDDGVVTQFIGRAPTFTTAASVVAGFVDVDSCLQQDLERETKGRTTDGESNPDEAFVSVETIEVERADAATRMELVIDDDRGMLILVAVGDVVTAFSFDAAVLESDSSPVRPLQLAALAAAKIAAAG